VKSGPDYGLHQYPQTADTRAGGKTADQKEKKETITHYAHER
jgi:hypothetical protein